MRMPTIEQLEAMNKDELIRLVQSLNTKLECLDQEYTVLEDDYNKALEELREFQAMIY